MLNTSYNDYLNLAKYATMTAINEEKVSPLEGGTGMAIFEAGAWALRNGKKLFNWSTLKQTLVPTKADIATYKNLWKNSDNIFQAASNQRAVAKLSQMGSTDKGVQNAIDTAIRKAGSTSPGNLSAEVDNIEKMQKSVKAANPGKIKKYLSGTKIGKFFGKAKTSIKDGFKAFKSSMGIGTKAAGTATKTTGKVLSKCGKFVKGNALFLAISGAAEVITNIVPTFKQLGKKAGLRQIGKSTAKVAGTVGGWALGAAIGSAICPGAGTLVGALVGLGCSLVCSWAGERLASAIVGKDELVLAQEKQAEEIAQAAQEDPEVQAELVAAAQERLDEEGMTNDGMIAQNSLNRIIHGQTAQTGTLPASTTQDAETVDTTAELGTKARSQITTNTGTTTTSKTNTQTPLFGSSYATYNPYSKGLNMFGNNTYGNYNIFGNNNMFGYSNPFSSSNYNMFNMTAFNPFGMNMFGNYGLQFPYGLGNMTQFNPYMMPNMHAQTGYLA